MPVLWVGLEERPVEAVNMVVVQRDELDGDFFINLGIATPPLLLGTPDEIAEQATRIGYVPVRTVARLAVSPRRLRELHSVLEQIVNRMDEKEAQP